MFLVHDIDWLEFSHKHDLLSRFIAPNWTRPQGIPIILAILLWIVLTFNNHGNYLKMIKIINLVISLDVLDKLTTINNALEILYVILNVFAFVGYGKIKCAVAQSKIERVDTVTHPRLSDNITVDLVYYISMGTCTKGNRSRSLFINERTFGRGNIPEALHLYCSIICLFKFVLYIYLPWFRT